jgi:predicted nucleic acid-binding protein
MAKKNVMVADTNVWVRYFIGDVESQRIQARLWFSQAEAGEIELHLHPVIVAEACYVMEKIYELDKKLLASNWKTVLSQPWIRVTDREDLLGLWLCYEQGFHFIDSFLLAWNTRVEIGVLTFDKKVMKKQRRN